MKILVTGAAGFIGAHTSRALTAKGHEVLCLDNFSDYYSPAYKKERIKELIPDVEVQNIDVANAAAMEQLIASEKPDAICHLAAQAGVRYSIENPFVYEETNLRGTLNILESCKNHNIPRLVFASSSSVYGGIKELPFKESLKIDKPVSMYAATKAAKELMAHSYHANFGLQTIGLRFFTVYGPWGRPDMALFKFTKAIENGDPIDVYGEGNMKRDFTYIDDIVAGIVAAIESDIPWGVYNLGNSNTVELMHFIECIEKEMGTQAERNIMPMQLGDIRETYADITHAKDDFGFDPQTSIEDGVKKFIAWFKDHKEVLQKTNII